MVDYYLPAGRWTHFLTGAVVEGGRWVREHHDYLSLPLMARPNSVIPVGALDDRPDYDYADGVTLHIFEPADGGVAGAIVPSVDGGVSLRVEVRRLGKTVQVAVDPEAGAVGKPWRALLRGVTAVHQESGCTQQANPLGVLLTPEAGATELTVRLG
jgi:alpha-D-xyloside xylohydrolase